MSKKLIGAILACLLLAACGGAEGTDDVTEPEAGATAAEPAATDEPAATEQAGGTEAAAAEFYVPGETVTFIVGYDAGGSTDIWARILANHLEEQTGAEFQVVNRGGAGGQIGYNAVFGAGDDCYTIGNLNLPSALAYVFPNSEATYTKDDFNFVATTGYSPNGLVVPADSEWQTLDDLVADVQGDPEGYDAASDSLFGDDSVAYYQLQEAADIEFNQVIVDGSADKVQAALSGQIDFFGSSVSSVLPQIENEQLRMIALYAEERYEFLPDVPTAMEQGYDIVNTNSWGVVMPPDVAEECRQELENHIAAVAESPEYIEENNQAGLDVRFMSAEETAEDIAEREVLMQEAADAISAEATEIPDAG